MPTARRTPAKRADPAFAPVPVAPRHDGWTVERQRGFIAALAETGCVSEACAMVGMTPRSAYRLRRRPESFAFDRAWCRALNKGAERLMEVAIERAIHGPMRNVRLGDRIVQERVPDTRLLIYLIEKLGGPSTGGLHNQQCRAEYNRQDFAEFTDSDVAPADDPVCAPGAIPGDVPPAPPVDGTPADPVSGATFATFDPPVEAEADTAPPVSGTTFATFEPAAAVAAPVTPPPVTPPPVTPRSARPRRTAGRKRRPTP